MIESVGYDEKTKTLEVKFNRGDAVYQYANVPKEEYDGLMKAGSIGIYFGTRIKGIYEFKKKGS